MCQIPPVDGHGVTRFDRPKPAHRGPVADGVWP